MRDPVAVILNASAGAGRQRSELDALLEMNGIHAAVEIASSGKELQRMAQSAVDRRAGTIVAGGGDGTIGTIASVIAGKDVDLGILPMGTLNHFAKDLGVPLTLDRAVRNLVHGSIRTVDVAQVNDSIFVNNSGLGLYPQIVREREKRQKGGERKWAAFLRAILSTFRRFPFMNVRLEIDGRTLLRRTPFVFVGNNMYRLEGFAIGSRPSMDRGEICICVAHRVGRWGLVRLAWHALIGRLREHHEFDVFCVKEATVSTRKLRMPVSLDGEVTILRTPLHYRTSPAALRVIVPATL
ncbi:MAG TPA: diacylglycerol kinase family protein [Bryobacteraceae bacterium]|nr:diacylglycerol kinase family protein [Bryobacteraceae bacterium]